MGFNHMEEHSKEGTALDKAQKPKMTCMGWGGLDQSIITTV